MRIPRNEAELNQRLAEIKQGVQDSYVGDKVGFVKPAFKLFVDCGLNTFDNISFLKDKSRCDKHFGCIMNPVGGIIRHNDLSRSDKNGVQKYYSDVYVTFNGVRYYVSNFWGIVNKSKFFNWLKNEARKACTEHWNPNNLTPSKSPTSVQTVPATQNTKEITRF